MIKGIGHLKHGETNDSVGVTPYHWLRFALLGKACVHHHRGGTTNLLGTWTEEYEWLLRVASGS
jgi:hypothetical protein